MTPTDQLRVQLLKANNTSYNAIDSMMKKIAKEHNITTTKLHKDFVKRYKMIPDAWIKKVNIEEDAPCWKDYKQVGTKKKNGKTVPNCVPKKKTFVEFVTEASAEWQRKKGKNPEGGLNKKGIASYRKQHPGSKLSLAVTTPPSKLDPDSKKAKRRKSFCARSSGQLKMWPKAKKDPNSRLNLARRKWNC